MKNKSISSFKNVVIFAFCFVLLGSLILSLSLPKKTSADASEPMGGWPEEEPVLWSTNDLSNIKPMDEGSEPDPDNVSIGSTFTGPSGTTYVLEVENISEQEIEDMAQLGCAASGVWVQVDEDRGNGDDYDDKYSCSGAPNWTCSEDSNGIYYSLAACQSICKTTPTVDPSQAQYRCKQCRGTTCAIRYSSTPCSDTCRIDENCQAPASFTRYSCNTSTWTCFVNPNSIYALAECRIVCQPGGQLICPGNSYCYACNRSTYQCYHLNSGTYTTLSGCQNSCKPPRPGHTSPPPPPPEPPLEDCSIYDFDLPNRAWVGYPITGSWSTNEYCIYGDVTCSSNTGGECYWQDDDITPIFDGDHDFTIGKAGEYTYTFTAYGESGSDQKDTKTKTIPAYNLPWWREIIPVLP